MPCFSHAGGRHLEIDGARIFVESAGAPTGDPVVLLHGGFGTLVDFNPLLQHMPDALRYIGIDLRGHGRSSLGPHPLTYARHQSDVEAVLGHLGVQGAALLGFSDGGIVAYRMAVARSRACRCLVTAGAQWRLEEDDPALPLIQGLTRQDWEALCPDSVPYYERVNPEPDFDALFKAVTHLWLDRGPAGYPGASVETIAVPTLITRGSHDPLFSLGEATSLQERIPEAEFLNIPFAGHAAQAEAPEILAAAIGIFLRRTGNT